MFFLPQYRAVLSDGIPQHASRWEQHASACPKPGVFLPFSVGRRRAHPAGDR